MSELPKLDNDGMWDRVYHVLKQAILTRQFKPNEKLNVELIAQQVGASRTPVRDAINRLAADGLVRLVPRHGTFVNGLHVVDMNHLVDTRLMMELWAVDRGLQQASDTDVARIELSLQQHVPLFQGSHSNPELMAQADLDFHLHLIELARNPRMEQMYRNLNWHMQSARAYLLQDPARRIQALGEHRRIVEAIKACDSVAARQAVTTHLNATRSVLEALIKQFPEGL